MATDVELLVRLKIADVVALTAANSLRRRMGYADVLEDLRRADYYLFTVGADDAERAQELVREIAERSILFVNPNKHVFEVKLPQRPAEPPRRDGAYELNVLVYDLDEDPGEGLLAALRQTPWGGAVEKIRAGVLWTLLLRAEGPEEAKRIAEEIALTKSRSKGLLANPHYQAFEIW